jgi:hypothetical protein
MGRADPGYSKPEMNSSQPEMIQPETKSSQAWTVNHLHVEQYVDRYSRMDDIIMVNAHAQAILAQLNTI